MKPPQNDLSIQCNSKNSWDTHVSNHSGTPIGGFSSFLCTNVISFTYGTIRAPMRPGILMKKTLSKKIGSHCFPAIQYTGITLRGHVILFLSSELCQMAGDYTRMYYGTLFARNPGEIIRMSEFIRGLCIQQRWNHFHPDLVISTCHNTTKQSLEKLLRLVRLLLEVSVFNFGIQQLEANVKCQTKSKIWRFSHWWNHNKHETNLRIQLYAGGKLKLFFHFSRWKWRIIKLPCNIYRGIETQKLFQNDLDGVVPCNSLFFMIYFFRSVQR